MTIEATKSPKYRGSILRGNVAKRRPPARFGSTRGVVGQTVKGTCDVWKGFSLLVTCCCWPSCLKKCGKADPRIRQAWREKIALCLIILILCGLMVFLTIGVQYTMCIDSAAVSSPAVDPITLLPLKSRYGVIVNGFEYQFSGMQKALMSASYGSIYLTDDWHSVDITRLFQVSPDSCAQFNFAQNCSLPNPILEGSPGLNVSNTRCPSSQILNIVKRRRLYFTWDQVKSQLPTQNHLMVFNGQVLNLTDYFGKDGKFLDPSTTNALFEMRGADITAWSAFSSQNKLVVNCLLQKYRAGALEEQSMECVIKQTFLIVTLTILMAVILLKSLMAIAYHWILSRRLVEAASSKSENKKTVNTQSESDYSISRRTSMFSDITPLKKDPAAIVLITCYSESERTLKACLDSVVTANYPQGKKLAFIVCDGIVTGKDNEKTTAEIVLGMIDVHKDSQSPKPSAYVSLGEGDLQVNQAMVYSGFYYHLKDSIPVILVIKTGAINDKGSKTPGNRGKRDSQVILMNFLSRVMFDDLMTPLDFELFCQIKRVTGNTPDNYEMVLSLDSDTKIHVDSIRHMINALVNDTSIMAVCGDSQIANKSATWVTAIQVYEYFINHQLGKAFESVFGGVTCLPGCFSMYRIKVPKGDSSVPILISPQILDDYSETSVESLHQKNLLLLGEDRYLTTLLLRAFPRRKTVYVPQAKCETFAPESFKVLLSQRRRWINSTIHSLMELILVRDLCGVFCFSMQFLIFLEILGTVVLPVSLFSIGYLIFYSIVTHGINILPLLILLSMVGLPPLLIVLTSTSYDMIWYMVIYLIALPIWNFILPLYSFWNFDDFTWGKTRSLSKQSSSFNFKGPQTALIAFKKWSKWEMERIIEEGSSEQNN